MLKKDLSGGKVKHSMRILKEVSFKRGSLASSYLCHSHSLHSLYPSVPDSLSLSESISLYWKKGVL